MKRLLGLCLLATIGLGAPVRAASAPPSDPETTFEAFWSLFDQTYALFEVKRVDWDAVHAVYRPRVNAHTSRSELFKVLTEATDHLNDVHVSIRDEREGRISRSGSRSIGIEPFETGEFSIDLIAQRYTVSPMESRVGGIVQFARLPGETGYIRVSEFRHPTATADAIDDAISAFASVRTVIVDVRQNGGGKDRIAQALASRFSANRGLFMTVENRSPGNPASVVPTEWFLEPHRTGSFSGRLIVLTNSRTISAAENFVLAIRTIPGAVVVGDVTAGAMADVVTRSIDDGWTFTIPVNVMRDRHGVSWEGVGLAPDLWIQNDPIEVQVGRDRVLEFAIALAMARNREPTHGAPGWSQRSSRPER